MRGPTFESAEEGKDALATVHDISPELIDEIFHKVDETVPELLDKYGVEDDVEKDVVREWIKIAFAEDIAWMSDEGVWDGDEDIQRILEDMDEHAVSNCTTVASRVASRNRDIMRLSGAIIQDTFSSGG